MEEVAEFVKGEYAEGEKVVEVGVGRCDGVARALCDAGFEVVATDVRDVEEEIDARVEFARDDVTSPETSVYKGAALVYSLRPPYEIHARVDSVARGVGADTLIAPLADEAAHLGDRGFELVNRGGRAFFVRRS